MKNKRFLRFLSFVFLMMVSGISFAMKNGIVMANNLPIRSIAPHPENNNVVAILRYGEVSGKYQEIMEMLNLKEGTRRIVPVPMANSGEKVTGIAFDDNGNDDNGKVIPKIEEYEVAKSDQADQYYIRNNENGIMWGRMWQKTSGPFALSPDKNCAVYYGQNIFSSKKVIEIYLARSPTPDDSINNGKEVTAAVFKNNYEFLIGCGDNTLMEERLCSDKVCFDRSASLVHDLSTFKDSEGVQEKITEEESKPKETPNNAGWTWRLPKIRMVMFSSIFLAVALLLYSQYFSRMPV